MRTERLLLHNAEGTDENRKASGARCDRRQPAFSRERDMRGIAKVNIQSHRSSDAVAMTDDYALTQSPVTAGMDSGALDYRC